ncbi:MAG: slipin family protein [Gemmatimonadota bacterium]|nr:MAG: slipin family protein [Gemmatimonadota bacterium]
MEILLAGLAVFGATALATSLRVLWEYERAVVFRLGRLRSARGPGLIFLVPFAVERMQRVSLRIVAMDIPPQDVITRDNVSVKVNAVLYFRVNVPVKAVVEVEDYLFATSQLAQTTLRSVIGQAELDDLLAEREKYNDMLREIIDEQTDVWGIEVTAVEVKDIDLPQEMKRAMARQAEAERERRAKVVNALGEFQASRKLVQAAQIMSADPAALQLRFLQTVSEIAAENNSTTLFPIPMDLFEPFLRAATEGRKRLSDVGEEGEEGLEVEEEAIRELPSPQARPRAETREEASIERRREK